MYDPIHTDPPRDEAHFWELVEVNFEHARHILEDYPIESEEDALAGTHRAFEDGKRLGPFEVIAYRKISDGFDQRDYFLEMGRQTLPVVREMIRGRELTPAFFHEWGKLQCCHGYLASHVFDDTDGMAQNRGGQKAGAVRSKDPQRRWIARLLVGLIDQGVRRDEAEERVSKYVKSIVDDPETPVAHKKWLKPINSHGDLATTYQKNKLTQEKMRELLKEELDADCPPVPSEIP